MSILTFIGSNRKTLYGIVKYINRESSGILFGFGLNPNYAVEEMRLVKNLLHKTNKRQYKHFIFSFDSDVNLPVEIILDIGYEIGSYYAGEYQIVSSVHFDKNNTHIHYVLNSVNIYTGKKYNQSWTDLLNYKVYINEILKTYGLTPIKIYGVEDEYDDIEESNFLA